MPIKKVEAYEVDGQVYATYNQASAAELTGAIDTLTRDADSWKQILSNPSRVNHEFACRLTAAMQYAIDRLAPNVQSGAEK